MPISVSAGLMGAFGNLFSRSATLENSSTNLQNMKILAAAVSPSKEPEFNANIVDDSAIEPEATIVFGDSGEHKPGSDQISIYVVREGDTLSQIAKMFDVSVNTIKWNNDITSSTVRPGQTLVILPISGVKHKVASGETLASIAKKYKGDIDEIAAYNGLNKSSALAVGSEIIIPDGEIVYSSSSGSSVLTSYSSGLKEYAGYYLRPIAGGKRTQGLHGYNAVDFGAPVGTPIMASADGEVIVVKSGGWNGGYGSYVVIKHSNGTQTLYAHMSRVATSLGSSVKQGDVIGYVGATGKATGSHVHFEIRGAKNPF